MRTFPTILVSSGTIYRRQHIWYRWYISTEDNTYTAVGELWLWGAGGSRQRPLFWADGISGIISHSLRWSQMVPYNLRSFIIYLWDTSLLFNPVPSPSSSEIFHLNFKNIVIEICAKSPLLPIDFVIDTYCGNSKRHYSSCHQFKKRNAQQWHNLNNIWEVLYYQETKF